MNNDSFHPVITVAKHSDSAPNNHTDGSSVGRWLWEVVSSVGGATDPGRFHKFVLPLILYKHLSDVSEDAHASSVQGRGGEDADRYLFDSGLVRTIESEGAPKLFDIPHGYRWEAVRTCPAYELGHMLTRVMRLLAEQAPDFRGILDNVDYAERQGDRSTFEADRLAELIHRLSARRLGIKDVLPREMGDAFEYLLRRFVESQGREAGNFYTPRDVVTSEQSPP
jgi:type I restriction enzyme M protein